MIFREPCLPPGWYPREKGKIDGFLKPLAKEAHALAAIAPHAGWYYSGLTAALAVSSLEREVDTVAVIGGHLPGGKPILCAEEDGVMTPFGVMEIDGELREGLKKSLSIKPDQYQDNTVEVLLPMVHYFFPGSKLLWLRFPADPLSFDAGKTLAETAKKLQKRIVVLASTDLTHYGKNYGFTPKGYGKPALEWVKKVNDAAFIGAVLQADPVQALNCAENNFAACSAGAVLGALGFCSARVDAELLDYRTSADVGKEDNDSDEILDDDVPDSFVGYAAISFSQG